MTGNEKLVLLWSSYIWKLITLNETKQARYSRPDPRRDSCMYVVTDTNISGSSEMCAEQRYKRSGWIVTYRYLFLLFLNFHRLKGGLTCEPVWFERLTESQSETQQPFSFTKVFKNSKNCTEASGYSLLFNRRVLWSQSTRSEQHFRKIKVRLK